MNKIKRSKRKLAPFFVLRWGEPLPLGEVSRSVRDGEGALSPDYVGSSPKGRAFSMIDSFITFF